MNRQLSQKLILIACLALMLPAFSYGQCANKLLWATNGIWAYRAVKCESKKVCNKPTGSVITFERELQSLGCNMTSGDCKCNHTSDGQIAAVPGKKFGLAIAPDLAIENRGCQNIDVFAVKIDDDYFQLLEFRYVPDDTKLDDFGIPVARNMRLAINLTGEPKKASSNLLVNDSAKVEGDEIVRTIGDLKLKYPLLNKGIFELEELKVIPAPKPDTPDTTNATPPATPAPTPDDSSNDSSSNDDQ